MRLSCPCCGAVASIEAFLADAQARQALAQALKLPPTLSDLTLRYLGLFRPAKNGLSWQRAHKLLSELQALIDSAQVCHQGVDYTAPVEYWQRALEQMLADRSKLNLPLKSHGYLIRIIVGYAIKATAKAEHSREQVARTRGKTDGPVAAEAMVKPPPVKRSPPPEGWKNEALRKTRGET